MIDDKKEIYDLKQEPNNSLDTKINNIDIEKDDESIFQNSSIEGLTPFSEDEAIRIWEEYKKIYC